MCKSQNQTYKISLNKKLINSDQNCRKTAKFLILSNLPYAKYWDHPPSFENTFCTFLKYESVRMCKRLKIHNNLRLHHKTTLKSANWTENSAKVFFALILHTLHLSRYTLNKILSVNCALLELLCKKIYFTPPFVITSLGTTFPVSSNMRKNHT